MDTSEIVGLGADVILRRNDVLKIVGIGKSTLYRRIAAGEFPPPVRLGGPGTSAVGWKLSTVKQWIEERQATAFTLLCPLCDGARVVEISDSEKVLH